MEERKFTTKRDAALSRRIIILGISAIIVLVLISVVFYWLVSGTPDVAPVWKYNLSSTTTNYTITITQVPYPVPLSKYLVQAENATLWLIVNDANLSAMSTGVYINGLSFTDKDNNDNLSVGDYFTFDKSIYLPGSLFLLFEYDHGHLVMQVSLK
jgi:hypothetical protein